MSIFIKELAGYLYLATPRMDFLNYLQKKLRSSQKAVTISRNASVGKGESPVAAGGI